MKAAGITVGVLVAIAAAVGLWLMGSYNAMVAGDAAVTNAWGQVETQYQRRFDLVPNLVAATKGVLGQEQKVFGDIAEARTHYASAKQSGDANDQVQATSQYEGALARLLVVMENYPVLQSYATVRGLTDELSGTENRVLVARDRYNDAATGWNVDVSRFPRSLLAGMFGFERRELFKADEGASAAPKVDLTI